MIQICRAEDGQIFQRNATVRDIERTGSLEAFVQQETGVEAEAVLAYLTDGRRLTSHNVRELAGSQDQSIFVFNKYYLDYDLEEVLRRLLVEAAFQPPIEESIAATPPFRPSQLATSYLRTAHAHHEQLNHLAISLQFQFEAARIASRALDMNVLAILDTFEGIATASRKELARQASLLAGLEADLEIISRVSINTEFVSPAVRKAIEAGEKQRTLGDYVSNVKMKQVAETCAKTHDDLQSRFEEVEQAVSRLKEGSDVIRVTVEGTKPLDDTDKIIHRARDIFNEVADATHSLENPNPESDLILKELKQLDANLRDELQSMVEVKNNFTRQVVTALRHISVLNNDIVQIPPVLAALQASFRGKNSFSHIQRLHNMLYAYGATVVEIVRRKEFARFFYQRAQNILDVMAKLSSSERKRRQVYRSDIHGQLPFETRGMEVDPVPTIDFSSSLGDDSDSAYSLERADVDGLLHVLDDLEELSRTSNDGAALTAVRECKASLDKLVAKMDGLESGFDRIAERSLLSASRVSQSRRRSYEADEQMYQEVVDQLRNTQDAKTHQEAQFQEERTELKGEIHRLQADVRESGAETAGERDRADRLERELHQVRAQLESESSARRILETRLQDHTADADEQRAQLEKALADVTEQTRISEVLRSELAQVRSGFADVKALEERNSDKIKMLLEEQEANLRRLGESQARGDNLEEQIRMARKESQEVKDALREAAEDKAHLLKAQASEHDRIMRDHIAEADGDRAVLERQFFEVKVQKDHAERQLRDARSQLDVAHADAVGLKEELQRVEHELREANRTESLLRGDLKSGKSSQSEYELRLEDSERLIAQILNVALAFRTSHIKAMSIAQAIALSAHPNSFKMGQSSSMADSLFSSGMRQNIILNVDEPPPLDPSDPVMTLDALRAFDHDIFLEAIAKTGSTVRKWQKQCKEYRERAKGKISFRNFAKGDLALFLPTRNSVSKPWAAFNVSFPHYFLQATGHLAEQLKTREWIVARITSITERVVDRDDPTSNPYSLGDGVKYYMLEVEDWTQPAHDKRKVSKKRNSDPKPSLASSTPALPSGPPEPEVEDTFQVAPTTSSHLSASRTRSNSSPTNARPSSLSRLLAQASPEIPATEMTPQPFPTSENRPNSPTSSPPPPPSPQLPKLISSPQVNSPQSPLRPGSRASRLSTTSRFSGGRIAPFGSVSSGSSTNKANPTTALSDQNLVSSPSSASISIKRNDATFPSPGGSPSDMAGTLKKHFRNRTTSYQNSRPTSMHIPKGSPLTNMETTAASSHAPTRTSASYWNSSWFSRKKADTAHPTTLDNSSAAGSIRPSDSAASDILKRFPF
ncbi:putative peripheral membrane protein [Lentinula edodes]|uniref:putative peripheral membrane protein n=1 Tax=Lentinula edodes TaxID=5353 RepID=UPI001E8E52DD|nr:putative peripheral membrane protein [Lentinula edodes]KAH7874259.1 putative peripheral membrane protein [Lentinula edodes]